MLFPIEPAATTPAQQCLRERLGAQIRLGTSSWHFPGWQGWVWAHREPASLLSAQGLAAYARHPLLRTVSLDRSFYRPLDAGTYAALATQVPEDFRFVVKAPSLCCDASLREGEGGRAIEENPSFLDADLAHTLAAQPAAAGLGARLGALVFQLSPMPARWWGRDRPRLHARLAAMFEACRAALPPGAPLGLELRDPALLGPELARLLKAQGVRYVLGLHDRMPPIDDQLPMLRALWPGPLICRWSLQRGLRYADAKARFEPFDRLCAPDLPTRRSLARVAAATAAAGHAVLVTINNKAEGCAPASVEALAAAIGAATSTSAAPAAAAGRADGASPVG